MIARRTRFATGPPTAVLALFLCAAVPAAGQVAEQGEAAPAQEAQAPSRSAPAPVATSDAGGDAPEPAPLVVWNRQITVFRARYGAIRPAERAEGAEERIEGLPSEALDLPLEWRDVSDGRQSGVLISKGTQVLFGLLEGDVDAATGQTLEEATAEAVRQLEAIFAARREQARPAVILRAIAWAVASVVLLGLAINASRRVRRLALARLEGHRLHLAAAGIDLWPFALGLGRGVVAVVTRGAVLVVAYLLLTITLRQLPYTRPWGGKLGDWVLDLLRELAIGFVGAVPGVVAVILIFLATRFVVRTMDALLERSKSDESTLPWLHPDTVDATRRIARVFIWLFAIVVAYPYIPGSSTTAFKGVTVFAGLVLSLGSSGLVNQVLSGFLLIYARALRQGDLVRIGETFGLVTHVGVLSTKILTPRREEITIPNTVVVSTSVVNYARTNALLTTSVTIGYDAPWRQVQSLLVLAAERTSGILREPPPVVLQRTLSDFYVEYELRCALEIQLERMRVLSDLHANIQDAFNEFGVQIMSPHFEAQPEGRVIAPRDSWYAAPAPRDGSSTPAAGAARAAAHD